MRVSNDPGTPPSWVTEGDEAHERIQRWAISVYRDEHPAGGAKEVHLPTCEEITSVIFDLYDGYYGCDCPGGCDYAILEAAISCAHGVSREFEHGEFGHVSERLAELEAWENRVREQTLNPAVIIGELPPGSSRLSMVVVYFNTTDYPKLYVARQHDIGVGRVAIHPNPLKVSASLEEVRAVVPVGMMAIPPANEDDPNIVEVYV